MSNSRRRKLIKSMTAAGSVVIVGKNFPSDWKKPTVNSVILPAHGATSDLPPPPEVESVTSEAISPQSGPLENPGVVVFGDVLDVTFTVSPNPGVPLDGVFEELCNGAAVPGTSSMFQTDANGVFSVMVDTNTLVPCMGTTGVRVTIGGVSGDCTWNYLVLSDRNRKENVAALDVDDVLEKVAGLPMGSWNYIGDTSNVRHIGPMAQDFKETFEIGDSDKHIHMVDANGVSIAAIQALYQDLQDKEFRIQELERKLNKLLDSK